MATATLPDLTGFSTYYGVQVSWIGDEGDMIALGHHDPRTVIAALNRCARIEAGLSNLTDDRDATYQDMKQRLAADYFIQLVDNCLECGGEPDCGACKDIRAAYADGNWWLHRVASADVSGAFPATYWGA